MTTGLPSRTSRVVVTGGAGFIGANLCRRLASSAVGEVVALDDLSSGVAGNLDGTGARLVVGSILDRELLGETITGASAVVHLAARPSVPRSLEEPLASHAANATGTAYVLEAARQAGVGHLLVASSSSVYGASEVMPKHESLVPEPVSPYAATKLATEAYALAWGRSYGINVLVLRLFNVFGPLQAAGHAYAAVIPAFVSAALEGKEIDVHGDGTQTRDFTFVDSVTEVMARALTDGIGHDGPVNSAFGTRTSLLEVIGELESILGHAVRRRHTSPRAGDVHDSQADQSLLRSLFGDIDPVPFREALERTVAWYRTRLT